MRRRASARIILTVLLVLSVILFFSSQGREDTLQKARQAVQDGSSPVMTYLTMPVRGFENMLDNIRARSQVHAENKRLKQELSRMRDIEARANSLAFKLSRFETILNADTQSDIPDRKIAARAVSEYNGPFAKSILINAGADKGVTKGDAVMTVDGLLGHVVRVGRNSSRVLHIEDLNSRISVMSERSRGRAILTGNNTAYPVLSFVAETADWQAGDRVVTSGDGGVLPPGLPIGELKPKADGTMSVDVYVNRGQVDWVWVYPYNPIAKPEVEDAEPSLQAEADDKLDHTDRVVRHQDGIIAVREPDSSADIGDQP